MSFQTLIKWFFGVAVLGLICLALYFFPPIHQRLAWRLAALQSWIFYQINPPDQVVLAPNEPVDAAAQATRDVLMRRQVSTLAAAALAQTPTPTFTIVPTWTVAGPTATVIPSPTPKPSPTPLPAQVVLSGFRYERQTFNNCGPANLAMALSYWGWQGDQGITKAALRPNQDDYNVMADEMAAFVTANTGLRTLVRVGGSLDQLKRLVAAGFPVLVEMGHDPPDDWWMGHYVLVSGYDDAHAALITQDSLVMPDLPVPYTEIETRWWRDFNRLYLVVFSAEREAELLAILGADSDPQENIRRSLLATEAEIPGLSGRDLFFALFNQGSDLLALGNANEAANIFDLAFAHYQTLEENQRPWRVLWYRTEAYEAYYKTGRYQAIIDLANATLSMLNKGGLEESHYWRGMAYQALGEGDRAALDFQYALKLRPSYTLAQEALQPGGQD